MRPRGGTPPRRRRGRPHRPGRAPARARRDRRARRRPRPPSGSGPRPRRGRIGTSRSGGDDARALRPQGDHDLGDAEREQAVRVEPARERARLVLVELEDRESVEHGCGRCGRRARAGRRAQPRETLRVEEQAPPALGQRRHGRRGEVRAQEPGDERPAGAGERGRRPPGDVLDGPGLADGVDRHDAVVALVVEAERGRLVGVTRLHRHAERLERCERHRAVGRGAAGDGDHVGADQRRGAGRVIDAAARARLTARDPVDGDVPDQRDAAHARAGGAVSLPVAAASARASTNETAKLGSVAPIDQAGGSRRCTCSTHQAGPVGESHW